MNKQVTQSEVRIVHWMARYTIKASGMVIYTVKPSGGIDEPYRVCIADGRATCSCKGYQAWHHCYHADGLLAREQALLDAERADYLAQARLTDADTAEHMEQDFAAAVAKAEMFLALVKQYSCKKTPDEMAALAEAKQMQKLAEFRRHSAQDAYEQLAEAQRRATAPLYRREFSLMR